MSKRFGFSDLVVNDDVTPEKYVTVHDADGNEIGSVECYFIEEDNE